MAIVDDDVQAGAEPGPWWQNTTTQAPPPPPAAAPTAAPTGAASGKNEAAHQIELMRERSRRRRRRRRLAGTALTGVILASAAASVWGWPLVLAGSAALTGAGGVAYAANRGNHNANQRGRNRPGGAGYTPGAQRPRRPASGGRPATSGRTRNPLAALTGGRRSTSGGGGKRSTGRTGGTGAAKGKTPAGAKPKTGTRSRTGPRTRGPLAGLLGRRTAASAARRTADGHRTTSRRLTGHAGKHQPRTVAAAARQHKRLAVARAKQRLGRQIADHNAAARMRGPQQRVTRRIAAQQARWATRDAVRQQRATARQGRHRDARLARERRRQNRILRRRNSRRERGMARRLRAARARRHYRTYLPQALRRGRHNLWTATSWTSRRLIWPTLSAPVRYPYRWVLRPFGLRARAAARRVALILRLNEIWQRHAPASARRMGPAGRTRVQAIWRQAMAMFALMMAAVTRQARQHPPTPPVPPGAPTGYAAARRKAWANPHQMPTQGAWATPPGTPRPARPRPQPAPAPAPAVTPRPAPQRRPAPPATARAPGSSSPPAPAAAMRHGPSSRNGLRPTMSVPARPARRTPRGNIPMAGRAAATAPADANVTIHPAVEAVVEALQDHVAGYEIPENGVLDVDSLIGSIPELMNGIGDALTSLSENGFGESPVHQSVVEMLSEFAAAVRNMADEAGAVHVAWRSNPDNEHDLRRANNEVAGAHLFNV